jgi:hypothetical protein
MYTKVRENFFKRVVNRLNTNVKFGSFWSGFWLKHVEPSVIFGNWFVLPFNGQARRLFCFSVISFLFKPTIGIETGTYYGTSTYLFQGIPTLRKTYSIESNSVYFKVSVARLEQQVTDGNLKLIHGDSKLQIAKILAGLDPETEKVIAYLDAHWEGDIPTTKEVRALLEWGGNWVAIIDDFEIPGPEGFGYGYDSYNGEVVNTGIFDELKDFSILVPTEDALTETGARRGTAYLVGGKVRQDLVKLIEVNLPLKLLQSR